MQIWRIYNVTYRRKFVDLCGILNLESVGVTVSVTLCVSTFSNRRIVPCNLTTVMLVGTVYCATHRYINIYWLCQSEEVRYQIPQSIHDSTRLWTILLVRPG